MVILFWGFQNCLASKTQSMGGREAISIGWWKMISFFQN
jgi:hypothetical protein